MNHKEQFYITRVRNLTLQVHHRKVQTNLHYKPWAHESHIIQKLKDYNIYMLSRSSITIKTYYDDDVLLKDTIPASTTYSSPAPGSAG